MQFKPLRYVLSGLVTLCLLVSVAFTQGVTTAAIQGLVLSADGTPLEGATVIAVHGPTQAKYGTIARDGGAYNFANVRVGGPYTLTANFVGYGESKIEGIYLNLGQRQKINFVLQEEGVTTDEVLITTEITALGGEKTGAETVIREVDINRLPTIARDLTDFTRVTPQATLTEDGDGELGFSVAGQNNRLNSLFIDGAISNDAFGLSDQGTNGGQSGVSPISIDAIEQFNIVVAPFDVTIGGFSGAGVNAVTRSGSNEVEASAYWFHRDQNLAGKTPLDITSDELDALPEDPRSKLADFSTNVYGFRVGAPIIKNKLFVFVNAELERRNTPQPFNFDTYNGNSSQADIENLATFLQNQYGYDAGSFLDNPKTVQGEKFLVKFDYNINEKHKLTARYSYTKGTAEKTNPSTNSNINFANRYELFPSITNSAALELNSTFSNTLSNRLIVGYTSVNDDRDPLGNPFPFVSIDDGAGQINFGSEQFSTANNLQQRIFTITDNVNIYAGKHNITIGTHNEFYDVYNLFVRQNYGVYEFDDMNTFLNGGAASFYTRSYEIRGNEVDDEVGDDITLAAADFNAAQLGFYVQDEFQVNSNLSLTAGVRVDVPVFGTDPAEDTDFNTTSINDIEAAFNNDPAFNGLFNSDGSANFRAGQLPNSALMIAPRVGFNWDVNGQDKYKIRGGVGLFTSRIPLVWPGGAFTNNGLNVGGVFLFQDTLGNGEPLTFRDDINDQYTASDFGRTDASPSGQLDLFEEDLRVPQVLRASLAGDIRFGKGWSATLEGTYTKTLNSIYYQNLNLKSDPIGYIDEPDPGNEVSPGNDGGRPRFDRRDEVAGAYDRILIGRNTNLGYTVNLTAMIGKEFKIGKTSKLTSSLAYNYGYAEAINDLTSSQNSSQWRNMEVVGSKNDLSVTRSDFSLGHRVLANLAYRLQPSDFFGATISLFYNGQSGETFSYVYGGGRADLITNQDSRDFTDLIFIPETQADINLVDIAGGATAAEQWTALNTYIENDPYLSANRGQYAERNGARTPATHIVDMRILVDIGQLVGEDNSRLQLSFDMFNFTNFLNRNWGRRYRSNFNGVTLIETLGVDEVSPGLFRPNFTFDPANVQNTYNNEISTREALNIDDVGTLSSRWQAQIGVRYLFN
ncbi:MAG: carboxypeptidase regulatory-like domain-containing protein [Bacteroidia bacterium]